MPNWITNIIDITGKPDDIKKLMAAVKGKRFDKAYAFDFDKILPQPLALKGIQTGTTTIGGKTFRQWRDMGPSGAPEGIGEAELEEIKKETGGCASWYDWNCKHWGTKWDACHPDEPELQKAERGKQTVIYRFDTAWAPPMPLLVALSKQHPKVELDLHWDDEGDDEWHECSIKNGKVTDGADGKKDNCEEEEDEDQG